MRRRNAVADVDRNGTIQARHAHRRLDCRRYRHWALVGIGIGLVAMSRSQSGSQRRILRLFSIHLAHTVVDAFRFRDDHRLRGVGDGMGQVERRKTMLGRVAATGRMAFTITFCPRLL